MLPTGSCLPSLAGRRGDAAVTVSGHRGSTTSDPPPLGTGLHCRLVPGPLRLAQAHATGKLQLDSEPSESSTSTSEPASEPLALTRTVPVSHEMALCLLTSLASLASHTSAHVKIAAWADMPLISTVAGYVGVLPRSLWGDLETGVSAWRRCDLHVQRSQLLA